MLSQLATILYISNYKESISPNFLIGNAVGATRLNDHDSVQIFNITIFYPTDPTIPCYVPRIANDQVLSVYNSKFSMGKGHDEIDVNKFFYFYISHLFYKNI
jgi:hypothetical protein